MLDNPMRLEYLRRMLTNHIAMGPRSLQYHLRENYALLMLRDMQIAHHLHRHLTADDVIMNARIHVNRIRLRIAKIAYNTRRINAYTSHSA